MVADSRRLANSEESEGHEERCDVIGLQQPFVHLRKMVEEGQEWRQQSHYWFQKVQQRLCKIRFKNTPNSTQKWNTTTTATQRSGR